MESAVPQNCILLSAGQLEAAVSVSGPADCKSAIRQSANLQVVRDGNLVSSRKPDDIPAFNREMIALFSGGTQMAQAA